MTEAMKQAAFDVIELCSQDKNMKSRGFKTGTQARNAIWRAMIAAAKLSQGD